jgi:Mg2+/Co2+ transporter CorB
MTRWFLILACWAVSFLFSGIEAGLLAIDPVRLRSQAKKEEKAAVRLQRLLRHPERLLVTVLLVTNMADILALLLLTHRFVHVFGSPGFLFALLVALPIYVFVLGVLPKSLFSPFSFPRSRFVRANARDCLDRSLACARTRETNWTPVSSGEKRTCWTPLRRARGVEANHRAK